MSGAVRIVGVIFLLGILGYLMKQVGFRGSSLFSLLGAVLLLSLSVVGVGEIFARVRGLVGEALSEIMRDALRILGVGYLFGAASDMCRELGEIGIANSALVLGRVEILLICLPYIDKLFGQIGEMSV